MEPTKKRMLIILALALVIVAGSFYSFWQKTADSKKIVEEPVGEVVIYVSGAVNKPGVFSIAVTSRVLDAITVAGGLTPQGDVSKVNMAQIVKEGMQIHVPEKPAELSNENKGQQGANTKDGGKVHLNTASKAELDVLPGVGPALAERILEYRQTHGNFKNIEEIKNVKGISEKKFEKMKDKLEL